MLKKMSFVLFSALIVSAMPIGSAQAASHSSASIKNLSWKLKDLNPSDGIAPGLHIQSAGTVLEAQVYDTFSGEWPDNQVTVGALPGQSFGVGTTSAKGPLGEAIVSSENTLSGGELNATGNSQGTHGGEDDSTWYSGKVDWALRVELAPYTSVTFSGIANLTSGFDLGDLPGKTFAQATMTGFLGQSRTQSSYVSADGSVASLNDKMMSLSFTNNSSQPLQGWIQVEVYVEGSNAVTAVPEPLSILYFVMGLPLILTLRNRYQVN